MLQVGIIGLPNVGKSSLFNALTSAGAAAENYPFCTVEPNLGIVEVPDERTRRIQELVGSSECVPAHIQFVDIAGLVRGASKGEGLGNQFLGQIREVDAIAHVVRCFEDPDITHVVGSIDPVRDLETIETELALADLETLDRRRERVEKRARSGEKDAIAEVAVLDRLSRVLDQGAEALSGSSFSSQELPIVQGLNLLSLKPVLYIANVGEGQSLNGVPSAIPGARDLYAALEGRGQEGNTVVPMSLGIEAEISSLEVEERQEFLEELGLEGEGSVRIIRAAYELLGLITFFSANDKQTTAWPITKGSTAPEAAGVIHTDFQRGFIRAETIAFSDFQELGSMRAARDLGAIRSEGKDYIVQDGDILLFRFNV